MNRIYKVIWSKAKNCYVVVSELAKSHTKSPASGTVSRTVVAGILASVLSCGAVLPVYASQTPPADANYVLYYDSDAARIELEGAAGTGTLITNLAQGTISAASTDAVNGAQLYALQSRVDDFEGNLSQNQTTLASLQSTVNSLQSFKLTANSAINSLRNDVDTGFNVTVNGAAVKTVTPSCNYINFKSGDGVTLVNDNGSVKISVNGDGLVASGNTGAITGGLAYTELRPVDGNYIAQANTTAANLSALDTQLKTTTDNLATEITNRSNADSDLDTRIGIVATDGNYIKASTSKNIAENLDLLDTKVKSNSDAVVQEVINRASADTALSNRIGFIDADGNYLTTTNTVYQNLSALDTQIQSNADAITANKTHFFGVNSNDVTAENYDGGGATGADAIAIGFGAGAGGDHSIAIAGDANSSSYVEGDYAIGIGSGIETVNDYGVAVGHGTYAKNNAVALGLSASAAAENSVAIGNTAGISSDATKAVAIGYNAGAMYAGDIAIGDSANTGQGGNSIAIGVAASSNGDAIAIGKQSFADAGNSVALGNGASLSFEAENSVVLGSNSSTSESDVIAVGADPWYRTTHNDVTGQDETVLVPEYTRRIVHVSNGTNDTDAVNVRQLNTGLDSKVNLDASNIGTNLVLPDSFYPDGATDNEKAELLAAARQTNATAWGNSLGTGTVADGNNQLITGGTLYTETRPTDSNYLSQSNTVAQNLSALDTQIKANADAITANEVHYFGVNSTWLPWSQLTQWDKQVYGVTNETEYNALVEASVARNYDGNGAAGHGSVAIGSGALTGSDGESVAIGLNAIAACERSTSLGAFATTAINGTAVGFNSSAYAGAFAGGYEALADDEGAIAIGYTAKAMNADSIAIGTETEAWNGIAIGNSAEVDSGTAVGFGAEASNEGTAYGAGATAHGEYGVAIGDAATATGSHSIALGSCQPVALGENSLALGSCSYTGTSAVDAVSLGRNADAFNTGSVAIGADSVANSDNEVSFGHAKNDTYNTYSNNTATYNTDLFRRLTNVADGVNDHDVVTVRQLNDSKTRYLGINFEFDEWTDANADELMQKYNVSSREEYENLVASGFNINGDGARQANSIAIGGNVQATSFSSIAMGSDTIAGNDYSIAIGHNINTDGVAIGHDITESGYGGEFPGIAIGQTLDSSGANGITIGREANNYSNDGVAIGNFLAAGTSSDGFDDNIVAIGYNNTAIGKSALVIGDNSTANSTAIAIGTQASADVDSIALGQKAVSNASSGIAIGDSSNVVSASGIAIGYGATAGDPDVYGEGNIAIGYGTSTSNDLAIAVGDSAQAHGYNAVALGTGANVEGGSSVAVGTSPHVAGSHSYLFGSGSLEGDNSTVVGDNYIEKANNSVVLGQENTIRAATYGDTVTNAILIGHKNYTQYNNSVAIGEDAVASGENVVSFGHKQGDVYRESYGGNKTYTNDKFMRLTNVADGIDDHDAATVKQLHENATRYIGVNAQFEEWTDSNAEALKSKYHVTSQEEYEALIDSGLNAHGTGATGANSVALGLDVRATGANSVAIGHDTEAVANSVAIGKEAYAYAPASVALGVANAVYSEMSTAVGFGNDITSETSESSHAFGSSNVINGSNNLALGNENVIVGSSNVALGLSNNIQGTSNYAVGSSNVVDSSVSGSLVLGSNSSAVASNAVTIGHYSVASEENSISLGHKATDLDADGNEYGTALTRKITNLADGVNETDAVTMKQYNALSDTVTSNKTHFFGVNSTSEYDMNYNGGGATGSNAVAIGSNAWASGDNSIAIGTMSGTYTGTQATAVGYISSAIAEKATAVGNMSQAVNISTVAVGDMAAASGQYSTAIGAYSHAKAKNSIAIGSDSYAETEDEVSFGRNAIEANPEIGQAAHAEIKRRLTHVDTAINDTDAVNFKQVNDIADTKANIGLDNLSTDGQNVIRELSKGSVKVVNGTYTTVTEGTDGDFKTYAVNVTANGTVANNDTGLITGGTVYNETRIADAGNYIGADKSVAENLTLLDTQVKANADLITSNKTHFFGVNSTNEYDMNYNGGGAEGTNAIAAGSNAWAGGDNSIAVGTMSGTFTGQQATAVGYIASAIADKATALGNQAQAVNTSTVAVGDMAAASGQYSTAIGAYSHAKAKNSIAIGSDSYAETEDEVSFGRDAIEANPEIGQAAHAEIKRRVRHVDTGINDTDAVNVKQLNDSIAGVKQHYIGVTSSAEGEADLNYNGQGASGVDAVALGPSARATAESSMALGDYAKADGLRSIAIGNSAGATNDYGIAIGGLAKAQADGAVALGTSANSTAANALAIGNSSKAEGATSYAIGQAANAKGESSIAFGTSTEAALTAVAVGHMAKAAGESGVAIGTGTNAAKTAIALGHGANASVEAATAIGINSLATANHAVAIGTGSVASEADTVSFGNTTNKRRLVNIADGTTENDAVNYKQLTAEATARENADTALSNRIGTIAEDKNYILKDNSVFANLTALDTQLKDTIQNLGGLSGNAVVYDADVKTKVSLAGQGGTVLDNVKAGQLNANSLEAVNGSQLYATNQNISGFAADINRNKQNIRELNSSVTAALDSVSTTSTLVNTLDDLKADASLNNLTAAGRQIIAAAAANAVQEYMAAQSGSNSAPMAPMMYTQPSNSLTVTDAGNGSLHVGEGSYVNGTSSIAIGVGNQVNANNSGAFGDPSIIDSDESYVLGNDDRITSNAKGSFIVGNDSKADAEGSLIMGSNVESTGKNGLALGNNTNVSAENSVALGSGSVASEVDTVSVGNDNLKRRIVNVMDGNIVEGSTDAVTGGQLFVTNEKVQQNTDALQTKAETDASNIDISKWAEKLGAGKVEADDSNLVTGGTVYNAIKDYNSANAVAAFDAGTNQLRIGGSAAYDGVDTINVAKSDGTSRVITGIVTNPDDPTSAANVGYVNAVTQNMVAGINDSFTRMNDRINKVGAGAAAMAGLVPGTYEDDVKWNVSAAVGNYRDSTAGAIGAFYKPVSNVTLAVKGSFGNGENMIAGGVGLALSKGAAPGITKAKLVNTVNAQAQTINNLQNQVQMLASQVQQLSQKLDEK